MPIIFISLSETFTEKVKSRGFSAYVMKIEDYKPVRKTYYVSPANSLCFMDGGIDRALSQIIFPGIEREVKNIVNKLNKRTLFNRPYLPIGSSIILEKGLKNLVVAPTMLLPQNVSNTQNAYYATKAILYNILINHNENINNVDIIFTSFCCGYGKMDEDESINQIMRGFSDYHLYDPMIINNNIILKEPNLLEQPKYYQNTEWFNVNPKDIVKC